MNRDNKFRIIFKFAIGNVIAEQPIDIGLIQDITNSYKVSTTSMGMPTQPAQNAYVMDMGVTRTYKFEFRRINPANPVNEMGTVTNGVYVPSDPKKWSNGFWLYIIKRFLVNKWQMETDGCKIFYFSNPDNQDNESEFYPKLPATNAYISTFTPSQANGAVNSISGNISFQIGATNILKEVANHTVILEANYATFTTNPEADSDTTNIVKVTDADEIILPVTTGKWYQRAIALGVQPTSDIVWSRYKTGINPDSGEWDIYEPLSTPVPLDADETTFYAIWVYQ